METFVEVIAQNPLDAIHAEKGGANRIELVSALSEGGLTPSAGMIKQVLDNTSLEVAVMLRPTSNSFIYDKYALEVMKKDAEIMQDLGVKRIVLGILDENFEIDFAAMDYVLENITKMDITFHRAIDTSKNILESIKKINMYKKVTHILTAGGSGKSVLDNFPQIPSIIENSRAKIMLGGGLTQESLSILQNQIASPHPYDIHFGSAVQDESGLVDVEKVHDIVSQIHGA